MKTFFHLFFFFFGALIALSCSHLPKGGKYVKLRNQDSLENLSYEFGVPVEEIAQANRGQSFRVGEFYFIPSGYNLESFRWPLPGGRKVTSSFGRRWGRPHKGIDIAAPVGAHILAADDGIVVFSGWMQGYGRTTVIAHRHGLFTIYAHARKNFTKKGDRVYSGQVIAQVGVSGNATGPHLHFEIRKHGQALNPAYVFGALEGRGGS